ncbi:MAG: DUF3048 domain-containing protein [Anaerolineales bacterium]|nr:DUF3048 domain-containing protein [Anaerolineales bacterium]
MKKLFALSLSLALLASSCSMSSLLAPQATPTELPTATAAPSDTPAPTDTPSPTPEPSPTTAPIDYGPSNFPPEVNPLTGLPVSDPSRLERRPLSVKIQLFPRADRPPMSLALADVVFDYYQNNGLTRFNALFLGNDSEQVGPVRSGRLLDAAIIRMYKAVFAFGGADKRILNKLFAEDFSDRLVVEGANNCPPMCRVDPNGFNFLVTNTLELGKCVVSKGVSNGRQNLDGMKFQSQTPPNDRLGLRIFTRYSISSYNRWDFDSTIGRYLRFQDTQEDQGAGEAYAPLTDRITNSQIAADNVVVVFAPHAYAYKSGNSEIIDIQLTGSGDAIAFRDGFAYDVKWSRPAPDAVLTLTNLDGSPYAYKPGITWYQMLGVSSTKETQEGGIWRFVIGFP